MDQIKSQVDNLAELGDEQVAQLQEAIVGEFESFESQDPTAETVDAMTTLADMLDTVKGEVQRREAAMEELTTRAAEAAMRVKGEDVQEEEDAMTPEEDMPVEEETPMEDAPETDVEIDEEVLPPIEEDEEKKKMDMKSYSATESVDASIETVDGSELSSDETEIPAEESVEEAVEAEEPAVEEAETEATVDEAIELSSDPEDPEVVVDTEESVEEVIETVADAEEFAADAEIEPENAPEKAQEEQEPVTASAEEGFSAPADRQPVIEVAMASTAITAGADIPGYTAGTALTDMSEVASAMEKRIHSLRRVNGGDGEQHIVASVVTSFPEVRTLSTDAESNMLKINAVSGPEALVASGGHAAPFEVKYDIYGLGSTTVRPVRDSLPRFQADRGGVRFVTPPSFAAGTYAGAVGVWTAANDSATTPSPAAKLSYTVTAAAENTVATDAVTLQLQFGNLMTRAYPELIARHNELALVQHAREAEQNLLSKIGSASSAVNAHVVTTEAPSLIGFARDFLVQVRKAAVAYRSRHRIDSSTQLQAIVPEWIYDAMAADLTLAMPGDGTLSVSRAEINGYLALSNVTMIASPDLTVFGSQGSSAAKLLEFPDEFTWYLYAEGSFLFLDGGTLDLGIIRDSTLVGTNDYKMFVETFEGIAFVGIESLAITTKISINGVAAALRDTTGGATAAAIEE